MMRQCKDNTTPWPCACPCRRSQKRIHPDRHPAPVHPCLPACRRPLQPPGPPGWGPPIVLPAAPLHIHPTISVSQRHSLLLLVQKISAPTIGLFPCTLQPSLLQLKCLLQSMRYLFSTTPYELAEASTCCVLECQSLSHTVATQISQASPLQPCYLMPSYGARQASALKSSGIHTGGTSFH